MYFKYKMEYVWLPVNMILLWRVMNEMIVSKSLYPKNIYDFFGWIVFIFVGYVIFHGIGIVVISSVDNKLKLDIGDYAANYIVYKMAFFVLFWLYIFHLLSLGYV